MELSVILLLYRLAFETGTNYTYIKILFHLYELYSQLCDDFSMPPFHISIDITKQPGGRFITSNMQYIVVCRILLVRYHIRMLCDRYDFEI